MLCSRPVTLELEKVGARVPFSAAVCAAQPAPGLDTLPLMRCLDLFSSGDVHAGLPNRLGVPVLPLNAQTVQFKCGGGGQYVQHRCRPQKCGALQHAACT
jgi:hypothetical protein